MSSFAKGRVGGRRGALVLVVAGALAAAVVVPSVFARAQAAPTNTAAPGIVAPPTVGGSGSAISSPTAATGAPPDQDITGCPPVQQAGPLDLDEISPPARLVVDRKTSTPSVITRSTRTIRLRFHVIACDGRTVRGALVYATPTPFQQFRALERATDVRGWATLTMTRLRFFPATPQQQNLIVFVRVRKPGEPLLEGISSRRLVSFRVRL